VSTLHASGSENEDLVAFIPALLIAGAWISLWAVLPRITRGEWRLVWHGAILFSVVAAYVLVVNILDVAWYGFSLPRWEPRVAAEALLTRTGEEAAENSRMRRDQLAVWPGIFGTEFDWVTPPVLNSQTRIAVEMCPANGVLRVKGYEQYKALGLPAPVTLSELSARAN